MIQAGVLDPLLTWKSEPIQLVLSTCSNLKSAGDMVQLLELPPKVKVTVTSVLQAGMMPVSIQMSAYDAEYETYDRCRIPGTAQSPPQLLE